MNRIPLRLLAALLTVVCASARVPAQQVSVPRATLTPSLGGAAGFVPGLIGGPAVLSPLPMLPLTPSLSFVSAVSAPAPAIVTPVAAISEAPAPIDSPDEKLTPIKIALEALELTAASRHDPSGGSFFDGALAAAHVAPSGRGQAGPKGFIKNADGVWVGGRVAEQSRWIDLLYAELSPHMDLAGVMDDAYAEGRVKLASVEKVAISREIAESSVHLEGTRNWVDAILVDAGGRNIAVHTHRVYFHPAPNNPASEISEGIRRVNKYLEKAKSDFAAGGLAEREMGRKLSQIELNFDTRGYREIENHLRGKEKDFHAAYGNRFIFRYITESRMASAQLRAEYNRLVEKYRDQPEGVMNIIDGVTYSREVGVGHELNSHKKRLQMGLKITQAGRDFFGKRTLSDGRIIEEYKTEFDAVTEPLADAHKPAKERDVLLWEDKSARVWMPLDKIMEETFLYKLRLYRENRAIIEESLGGAPLKVAFSVDVGGRNPEAAKRGLLVWDDPRQKALLEHLKASAPALSAEYGFPVSFIFVNSRPGEDPDLFNQQPIGKNEWAAPHPRGGRKHGRR